MSTASRRPIVVLAFVVASSGCGLFEGDGGNLALFDGGGGAPTRDDSGKSNGSDAHAKDGGKDAHGADARTADATKHDADDRDVRESDAGAGDAHIADATDGAPLGFCAAFVPPTGTTALCEDFDENPDAAVIGTVVSDPGGALAVESTVADSKPNAMLVTATTPTSDGGLDSAYLSIPLGVGTTFTIAFDIMVTELPSSPPPSSSDEIAALAFAASNVGIRITPGTATGTLELILDEDSPGGFIPHPVVVAAVSGWFHVELGITNTGPTGVVDTFAVNGQVLEANYLLDSEFDVGSPTARVGWVYATSTTLATAYFDNVVATWE